MKIYHPILFIALLLQLSACKGDLSRRFLSGIFVNSATGKYSTADDTLHIEDAGGNNFFVYRHTGYNIIENGKPGKRIYQKEQQAAVYDESTKTLIEIRKGKLLIPFPDSGFLMVGKRKYIKK